MQREGARHGVFGMLLGLLTLVVPGVLAIVVGVLRNELPQDWLRYPPSLTDGVARGLVLAAGVGLLVVAKGFFSFRRLGWLGYAAWAAVNVVAFIRSLQSEAAIVVIAGFPLMVALGIPYLWIRRRDYGIGPQPNLASGGR